MMPPLRGLLNSSSAVFLTVPIEVAMNTYWSAGKLRFSPVRARATLIFSPSCSGNMLTMGRPREPREPAGTSHTLSQYSRPRLEKHRM
ncbi:hypothetical protein D3C72_1415910 [compost metagenome]